MIRLLLATHGNGFWLHMLGAVAIMGGGWWFGYPLIALIINSVLWPARELWQKRHAIKDFFRFHPFLEWFPAVFIGAIIYGVI